MYNITTRTLTSPYTGDTTKNTVLSNSELDGNFISLKSGLIKGGSMVGDTLVLIKNDDTTLSLDLSAFAVSGGTTTNNYNISGGTAFLGTFY